MIYWGNSHLQSHLEKLTFKVYMPHGKLGYDFELEADEVLRFESQWAIPNFEKWRFTALGHQRKVDLCLNDVSKNHLILRSQIPWDIPFIHFFLGWFIIPRTLLLKSRHEANSLVGETHPLFDKCIGLIICLNLIKNIPLCMPIQFSWLILKPIYLHYTFWYFNIAMEAMGR